MERTNKDKGLYMVISVLLAIALWMYMGNVVNPDKSGQVRNLPVTFVGLEALESHGLMIGTGADQTVTLDITGKWDAVKHLSTDTVSAIVDVTSIQQAGQYTQAYQIAYNLPGNVSDNSLTTTDRYPLNVTFTVVRRAVRSIPVRGSSIGNVAEGYQAGEFSFSPAFIEVSGEESLVNQINYAQVTLDQDDLSQTYSGDLPYTFIGFNGETIDAAGLETNISLVHTTLPVVQLKEVPLVVNLLPGGGATEDNGTVTCTVTPSTIMVSGAAEDLEPLKEISLGNIDLSKVMGSDTLTILIPLAAELNNVSGYTEATVKITIQGLSTATLEVDNIEFINAPAGYVPKKETQSRQVQIRGTAEAVASVTPAQLRIVADLENAVAATGTQTIPVKVYLDYQGDNSDVGVIGEYNIVVSISKQ